MTDIFEYSTGLFGGGYIQHSPWPTWPTPMPQSGWICPRCGSVYGPSQLACYQCNGNAHYYRFPAVRDLLVVTDKDSIARTYRYDHESDSWKPVEKTGA